MLGSLRGRLVVIVAVIIAAAWSLYHTYDECMETPAEVRGTCSPVKLGLDLQGGMHLVLEVEDREGTMTPEARADATDRALKIIRTRIDQFGVSEPLIQKVGEDRIIVELPGIRDEARAKEIIQQTAFLEFQLVEPGSGVVEAMPRMDRAVVEALGEDALADLAQPEAADEQQAIEELVFGRQDTATDTLAGDTAADTIAADTTGALAAEDAASELTPLSALLLQGQGEGEFLVAEENVERVSRFLALESVQRALPRGVELHWGNEAVGMGARLYRPLFVLRERPFMTGERLEDAQATRDPQYNQTVVTFELNQRGGRDFEEVTSEHVGDRIAIVLDQEVYSAPVVQSVIRRSGQIEMGNASMEEARDLALVLRAGALPAPLRIMEERTVGPSLGQDSVEQGQLAGMIGIVFIILIMIGYYRVAGTLAVGALVVYVMIVLGLLAAFGAALTLPGIAGLVLSIGMAVDANVLIFERTREELAAGRTVRTAVDAGFEHAMSAIIDANVTTLITALILYQVGTGPVQGFAVTLSIGIIASFFSAVYVTRSLFLMYLERKRGAESISI